MILQPLNLELLNLREQQAYPMADWATATDTTGAFTLPRHVLLGFSIAVDGGLGVRASNFYLSGVTNFGDGVLFEFSYSNQPVCSVVVPTATHTPRDQYAVVGRGDFASSKGSLTVGRLDGVPAGAYSFDLAGGRLEADCVRPQLARVTGLVVDNHGDRSETLVGPVALKAGDGAKLSVVVSGGTATVRFDAAANVTSADCPCADDAAAGSPIVTVNGVSGGSGGSLGLNGTDCLQVTGAGGSLTLADTCSKACCGQEEVDALLAELAVLEKAKSLVDAQVREVAAAVATLTQNVLASRLVDGPYP